MAPVIDVDDEMFGNTLFSFMFYIFVFSERGVLGLL